MKTTVVRLLSVLSLSLVLTSTLNAALHTRLGGKALYDDVLNITWLADGKAAAGTVFDDGISTTDGKLTWDSSKKWAASLTVDGISGWRLPKVTPINGSYWIRIHRFDGSTDVGENVSRPGTVFGGSTASEMAHLFFNTLGNVGDYSVNGSFNNGCIVESCLTNTGPFKNLQSFNYWSGSEWEGIRTDQAWDFSFKRGTQLPRSKTQDKFVLAVHDGDVTVTNVPEPPMLALLGTVFAGLAGFKRKRS